MRGHAQMIGERRSGAPASGRQPLLAALLTAAGIAAWTAAIFAVPSLGFVIFTPRAKTGFDISVALLSLFVAIVLLLFPDEGESVRLDWVALGLMILAAGALVFGYLLPVAGWGEQLGRAMYCSLAVRTTTLSVLAIGLVPSLPPRLTHRTAGATAAGAAVFIAAVALLSPYLPRLTRVDDPQLVAARSTTHLVGLTGWHWTLSLVPILLAVLAVAVLVRDAAERSGLEWLIIALTLLAGSQLHTMFWPSAYSPVLTTASVLRLAFTVVMAGGAVLALRRIAVERAALLRAEQEVAARLAELTRLRNEFTAMVAHELAAPVGALRAFAAALGTGSLSHEQIQTIGAVIQVEVGLLATLIDDLRGAARAEQTEFDLELRPVALGPLLADATAFARNLPDAHPIDQDVHWDGHVQADAERIGQVLRNLLGNAGKYTPPGTPITLRAERRGNRARIEVVDRGSGIAAEDEERIFEKFGRGRTIASVAAGGMGLGLYLSRRIVQAHGGELRVEQTPGGGATFWFTLPIAASPDESLHRSIEQGAAHTPA
jgi:signal transduction histidine kinase